VKLSEVDPFNETLAAPNALIMTGGAVTVIFALDVFPVPPSVEVTCTLLFFTPAAVLCTFRETVHDALAASVPADKLAVPEPASAVVVPPQVLVRLFGVATASPAGKLSVKPKPVSGTPVFGLFMLNVSDVVPVRGIVAAPNALVIAGGLATVRFAEAVFPVPPFVELTAPLTFVYWPDAVPVTFTSTVQEVFAAAMLPPVTLMLVPPATAVAVPPHVLESPFGVVTTKPMGSVSVNATPVSATVLAAGSVTVKVREVVPFRGIAAAPNALAIEGGATTLRPAEAVPPVPPSVEVTALVTLFCCPAAVPVTFTEKLHELLAASVAADKAIALLPAVAVIVPPPQIPVRPLGVETTNPAGSVSLKPIPERLCAVLLF